MEPFTIICETCAARLKVKRPSMINQVLACPKCDSMVRVVAPEGWKLEDDTVSKLPSQSIEDHGDLGNFDDVDDLLSNQPTSPSPKLPTQTPAKKPPTQRPPGPKTKSDGPILPDQNWTSDQTKQRQKLTFILAASLAGLLIVIGIVAAIVVNSKKPDTAKNEDNSELKQNESDSQQDSETDEPAETDEPETNENDQDPDQGTDSQPASIDDTSSNVESEQTDQADSPPTETEMQNSQDNDVNDTNPNPNQEDDQENKVAPQDRDPLALDLDNGGNNKIKDPLIGASLDEGDSLSTRLGQLNELLANRGTSLGEIADVAKANRMQQLIGLPKYYIEKPSTVDKTTNLNQALSENFGGLMYDDVALSEFMRDLSSLTGVPTSVHVESLIAAGIQPDPIIKAKISNLSLSDYIDQSIEPIGLIKRNLDTNNGLIVLAKDWDKPIEKTFPMPTLIDDSPEGQARFVRTLRAMFDESIWTDASILEIRGAEIYLKQVPQVVYQINRLLNKLDAAKKVNSGEADPTVLRALTTTWSRCQATLQKETSFDPRPAIKLPRFLRGLEQQTGTVILANWFSLSQEGWTPQTEVTGEFDEANLESSLQQLCRSMKITYRSIDETTFEILTFQEESARPELQVYPVGDIISDDFDKDAFMEIVQRAMQVRINQILLKYDQDVAGETLIVIAPQSVQRELESVLARMRKGS